MPTKRVEARKTKRVAANETGPDEEREQGGATPGEDGWKNRLPQRSTLQPHLRLSLRGSVERQAQPEPDRLDKPEPVRKTDRYAIEPASIKDR